MRAKTPSVTTRILVLADTFAFKAHPVADRFTRLFTQKLRHAAGGSAGSKPPWLQKHDHAFPAPVRTQHMERHQRRFARTRRRNKDRACMMRQCLIKLRQNSCHGKIGQARQRLSIFCIVRFGGLHERCGIVQPSGPVDVLPRVYSFGENRESPCRIRQKMLRMRALMRLRRIKGQAEALERAVEAGTECAALLQQIAALRGAANGLMAEVLESHFRETFGQARETMAQKRRSRYTDR